MDEVEVISGYLDRIAEGLSALADEDFSALSRLGKDFETLFKTDFDPSEEDFLETRELLEELIDEFLDRPKFRKFIIHLMGFWPHIGCCLIMSDLQAETPSLKLQELEQMFQHDECHEMNGSRDGCIGPHLLLTLHCNTTAPLLSKVLNAESDWPEEADRQWFVGKNPNTDPEVLSSLAKSELFSTYAEWMIEDDEYGVADSGTETAAPEVQAYVAWAVASNPSTPVGARQVLATLTSKDLRWDAASTSGHALEEVCEAIRGRAAATGSSTPPDRL